jgi:uncharacterized cupin superfamily protein
MPNDASYPHLVRAADIKGAEGTFSHPWNPNSQITGTHLSKAGGVQRAVVSIVRIAPGKVSFAYNAHHLEEEWIYVLSGRAMAEVDGGQYEIGAGDFIAFPTKFALHLRNRFSEDGVYLMGGVIQASVIDDFTRLGKRLL